ncbi:MAG: hypothetical protein ABI222_14595, partial [Opitutaceae bacterium]
MFPSLLRRLTLVCFLPLAAHASSLVTLKVTPLSAEANTPKIVAPLPADAPASTYALQGVTLPLGVELHGQVIPGLDPALTPLTATVQDSSLHVVARDQAGAMVLLRYDPKTGWTRRTAPPGGIFVDAFPVGQSHIVFVQPSPTVGKVQLIAYHTITNTWSVIGDWASPGAIASVSRAPDGFAVTTREANGEVHAMLVTLVS